MLLPWDAKVGAAPVELKMLSEPVAQRIPIVSQTLDVGNNSRQQHVDYTIHL